MTLLQANQSTFNSEGNIYYPDIASLKAADPGEREGVVILGGRTTEGDDSGGEFYYSATTDRSLKDDALIIDPTDSGVGLGCWVRLVTDKQLSLNWFGSDNTAVANLLELYGREGCHVLINGDALGGLFTFFTSEVINHDGVNNFNGWVRTNDSRFLSDIDMNTYKVTNATDAVADTDLPTFLQVKNLIAAFDAVTADSTQTTNTLEEWFGSKGQDIDVLTAGTSTAMTLDTRFTGLPVVFDDKAGVEIGYAKYKVGSFVQTKGLNAAGDGSGGLYFIKTQTQADTDGDDYTSSNSPHFLITGASPVRVAVFQLNDLRSAILQEVILTSGQTKVTFGHSTERANFYASGLSVDSGKLDEGALSDYTLDVDGVSINLTNSYPSGTTITLDTNVLGGNQVGYVRIYMHPDEATAIAASVGDLINLHVWPSA